MQLIFKRLCNAFSSAVECRSHIRYTFVFASIKFVKLEIHADPMTFVRDERPVAT